MTTCSQCDREAIIVCICGSHNLCRYHMNQIKLSDEEILDRVRDIENTS